MKKLFFASLAALWAAALVHAGEPTWSEKVAQRLAQVLQPGSKLPTAPAGQPVMLPEPAKLTNPYVAPPVFTGIPPRPGLEAAKPVRPQLTREPAFLAQYRAQPETPQEIVMPTTGLVVLPSKDVNQTTAVPILNQPLGDRASLGDATLDASIAAVLANVVPLRDQPVPFTAVNLPDPFELRQTVKLTNTPPELEQPQATPLRILLPPVLPATK